MKKVTGLTNILMLTGLIVGLLLFTFNVIGFNFGFFPGDLGDGRLNLYFLEHAHQFFTGKISSFWNAVFMYPEHNLIAFSDNLLGSAPIFSLFRLFGFDIYKSYQLWFVVVSALNYISAFYFLKYLFKNNYSAVLGAFVFGFSLALQSQLTHAQTFPRFAIPLAFLMVVKFSEEFSPKYFFYTLLSVVYQIYCGIYLGFMLAVPIGIYLVLIFTKEVYFEKRVVFSFKWRIKTSAYTLLNILILLPLMLPYMGRNLSPSFRHYTQISHTIPTIKSHFFSQEGSLIWDFLSKTGQSYDAWWDHQIFAGSIATICLILVFYWLISHSIKTKFRLNSFSTPSILALTGLVTFFIYIRYNTISAYIFLYFLPGFSSMRSLTRIINIELIFFAIATAYAFGRIFKNNKKLQPLLFIAALGLIVCDNYFHQGKSYRTEVSFAKERTRKIEPIFSQIPLGSIVSYEPTKLESASIYYQIDAMLTSQKYGLKTLNGYTATSPGDYVMYWNEPNEKSRNHWLNNKSINQDTLYVINDSDHIEKVPLKNIQNSNVNTSQKERIKDLTEYIKTDTK